MATQNETRPTNANPPSKRTHVLLWTLQGVLALVFLFAGGTKLVMPVAELTKQTPLPGGFLRFIGVCEVLGALGLVLPGIVGVRRGLTPLAATGLVLIMIGAVVVTLGAGGGATAAVPLVIGVLAAVVAIGRRRWARRGAEAAGRSAQGGFAGPRGAGAARH